MSLSAPTKFGTVWNNSAINRNTIPVASQIGITAGLASYTDGFPPLTMTPVASGGIPPFGQDFNGIMYAVTSALQWLQSGTGYAYDSTFATTIGGYPLGAAVARSDGLGWWINTVANNSTAPETGGAGWVPENGPGITSIAMTSSSVTLTYLQAGLGVIIITGTITANLNLIFPTYQMQWQIVNNTTGAFTITAKTASGSGVALVTGQNQIYGDGTNINAGSSLVVARSIGDSTNAAASTAWSNNLLNGQYNLALTSSNVTLTASQYGQYIINCTGVLTANVVVFLPASTGTWQIRNNTTGAFIVTFAVIGTPGSVYSVSNTAGSNTATIYSDGVNVTTGNSYPVSGFTMRNRIINGAMQIDQWHSGAQITPTSAQFVLDRFRTALSQPGKITTQQITGTIFAAQGFQTYLAVTSTSSYAVTATDYFTINQPIEAVNISDFNWGTAAAQPVTLSFYVYSSLTGTFGGSIQNYAGNRSYPFSYTVPVANTVTKITITVPGDTGGSWVLSGTGGGLYVVHSFGAGSTYSGTAGSWTSASSYISSTGAVSVVGTSGATFYLTGVDLEPGTISSNEHRLYGAELALCQRYALQIGQSATDLVGSGQVIGPTTADIAIPFKVPMRAAPSISVANYSALSVTSAAGGVQAVTNIVLALAGAFGCIATLTSSGLSLGYATLCYTSAPSIVLLSAEL